MSGRFVALCAVGLAGSLFLGYCVYFDRKRRADPDYKKKVLARELWINLWLAHVPGVYVIQPQGGGGRRLRGE